MFREPNLDFVTSPQACLYLQSAKAKPLTPNASIGSLERLNLQDEPIHETRRYAKRAPHSSIQWNLKFATADNEPYSLSQWRMDTTYFTADRDVNSYMKSLADSLGPVGLGLKTRQHCPAAGEVSSWISMFERSWKASDALVDRSALCWLAMQCRSSLRMCGAADVGKASAWLAKRYESDLRQHEPLSGSSFYISSKDTELEHSVDRMMHIIMQQEEVPEEKIKERLRDARQVDSSNVVSQNRDDSRSCSSNPKKRQRQNSIKSATELLSEIPRNSPGPGYSSGPDQHDLPGETFEDKPKLPPRRNGIARRSQK